VPTQIDGDAFGSTPLDIEAGAADLRLIVPLTPSHAHRPAGRPRHWIAGAVSHK
jgi:hypothetical protein